MRQNDTLLKLNPPAGNPGNEDTQEEGFVTTGLPAESQNKQAGDKDPEGNDGIAVLAESIP